MADRPPHEELNKVKESESLRKTAILVWLFNF
jgi:hypothetical protein